MTRPIDIDRARRDTPGCDRVLHFNNAGAALQPRVVLDSVLGHLQREAEIGGYEAEAEAAPRRERIYHSLARLLNAAPSEIALVDNATRAFDMAFHSLPLHDGDIILTTESEYPSNVVAFLRAAHDKRLEIQYIPSEQSGELSLDALEHLLHNPRVRVVSISHVPTQSGLVQPVHDVGRLTRSRDVWYLLDATQSAGQMPLDVRAIGCDALAATGRKFLRGPRGTGFLYVRNERVGEMDPIPVDLHAATWSASHAYALRDDARRFETWEQPVAALLGMGAAVEYALSWGIDAVWQRIQLLAARLRQELLHVPGVTLRDPGTERCGIVTFTVDGIDAQTVQARLAGREPRINVTVSTRNSAVLDFARRGLDTVVRASVHYYLTETDAVAFATAVRKLQKADGG